MYSGKHNYFALQITGTAQIVGDTTDNVVVGTQPRLGVRARIVGFEASSRAIAADETALISVYADATTKVADQLTMTSAILAASMVQTAAVKDKAWPKGTIFNAKEECTADTDIDDLCITIWFKSMDA